MAESPVILMIDTALQKASVCLYRGEKLLGYAENSIVKDHASWLQPAIENIFHTINVPFAALDAVSIVAGPGSYTGLLVGLSSAKGICYALQKPLMLHNTLEVMADAAIRKADADIYCPMIDARRMEVFTAAYSRDGNCLIPPHALVLDQFSYDQLPKNKKILHFGDGSAKFIEIIMQSSLNFAVEQIELDARDLYQLSLRRFHSKAFSDLAYAEPFYLKEFYSVQHT